MRRNWGPRGLATQRGLGLCFPCFHISFIPKVIMVGCTAWWVKDIRAVEAGRITGKQGESGTKDKLRSQTARDHQQHSSGQFLAILVAGSTHMTGSSQRDVGDEMHATSCLLFWKPLPWDLNLFSLEAPQGWGVLLPRWVTLGSLKTEFPCPLWLLCDKKTKVLSG